VTVTVANESIVVTASPATGLIDEPVKIHASGLTPGAPLVLRAFLLDSRGTPWTSRVSVEADARGTVAADCDGLISSLTVAGGEPVRPFDGTSISPLRFEIVAEMSGRPVAVVEVCRRYVADGVRQTELSDRNRSGLLFEPPADGPRPGVVVVGGSSGGLFFASQMAALLAGHGFTALALAYFGGGPLPPHLVEIPLEYFTSTLDWFSSLASVKRDSVGVMGISRGAELVMLLGSRTPLVRAVVAYSPSNIVWSGLRGDSPSETSAWTHGGKPIPFASLTDPRFAGVRKRVFASSPIELMPMFEAAFAGHVPAEAAIPVEQTNGPILLVSGEDDRMWPATWMGERIMERLAACGHPFPSRHVHYPEAGHFMRAPGVSTSVLNGKFALGGKRAGQATANRAAWTETLSFLGATLGMPERSGWLAVTGGQRCR
jgi:dienelactone hydrolase